MIPMCIPQASQSCRTSFGWEVIYWNKRKNNMKLCPMQNEVMVLVMQKEIYALFLKVVLKSITPRCPKIKEAVLIIQ